MNDDDVPECLPAAVEIDDENDPTSGVTERFDVTASIACDAASVLSREQVQEMFQDALSQGVRSACLMPLQLHLKLMRKLRSPNPIRINISSPGSNVLFEFACDKISNLGAVGSEHGVKVYRLCKEDIDLEDPESIEQLSHQVKALPGCSIHCPIECKPWSQWQRLNQRKYTRLSASIRQECERSEEC